MTTKQFKGLTSKDGSLYIVFTDGQGNLMSSAFTVSTGGTKTAGTKLYAKDGSLYVTLTNGNGILL